MFTRDIPWGEGGEVDRDDEVALEALVPNRLLGIGMEDLTRIGWGALMAAIIV